MAYEFKTRVRVDGLIKDLKRLYGKEWPRMLANYIADMASAADDGVTLQTRRVFDLNSEYIPRGIRSTPSTQAQINKVANSLAKYYDGFGAVYLRGSPNPKRSLSFMVDHEVGRTRKPQKKYIATPGEDMTGKAFKSQTGKVVKRWKPKTILHKLKTSGSTYDGRTTITRKFPNRQKRGNARMPGSVFLIRGKGHGLPVVVRRITRGGGDDGKGKLESLYVMHDEAEIKGGQWRFEDTVIRIARRTQRRIAMFNSNRMAARFK